MDITKNPYAIFLAKVSGIKPPPVKARQGAQQLMHDKYDELVAPVVEKEWNAKKAAGLSPKDKNDANFRLEIARKLFKSLPKAEREEYEARAQRDKEAATEAYKVEVEESRKRTPENRQRYAHYHVYRNPLF